jgi:hypothetical protein
MPLLLEQRHFYFISTIGVNDVRLASNCITLMDTKGRTFAPWLYCHL